MTMASLLFNEREDQDRARLINGVMIGIVTDNQDPEELGRVRVRYANSPSQSVESGYVESGWAKLSTPMAGVGRGVCFLPEVNDEVLVAFGLGNIDDPYVIGALWNSQDPPPETNADGSNDIRVIQSRSGHELLFNDNKSGQAKLEIRTAAGHQIILDDTDNQEKIQILEKSGNNAIEIDSAQDSITIESKGTGTLKLKAQTIEIEARESMKVSANGMLEISGTPVKLN